MQCFVFGGDRRQAGKVVCVGLQPTKLTHSTALCCSCSGCVILSQCVVHPPVYMCVCVSMLAVKSPQQQCSHVFTPSTETVHQAVIRAAVSAREQQSSLVMASVDHLYLPLSLCVCVCTCVCVRERNDCGLLLQACKQRWCICNSCMQMGMMELYFDSF